MANMLNNYTKNQKLGEGTYGAVFRATENTTGEYVALKIIRMDQEEDGIPDSSLREVSILKMIHHSNIIYLRDVVFDGYKITMIFDFMDKDLKRFLDNGRKKLQEVLRKSYAFQLIAGLYYLHSNGIIHQDIRPENLLINRAGYIKIGDFGSSQMVNRTLMLTTSNVHSMLWYRAPELLIDSTEYGFEVDIWSVGCVIAEMSKGKVLFVGDSPVDQLIQICKILGTPTEESWPEFKNLVNSEIPLPGNQPPKFEELFEDTDPNFFDLLRKLLTLNPAKRISAKEAINHPYFNDISEHLREACLKF